MQAIHEKIQNKIEQGELEEARQLVETALLNDGNDALLHYLKGKIFLKNSDWRQATNSFLRSEQLDADSPAAEARKMLADIMDFYHKDLYNP